MSKFHAGLDVADQTTAICVQDDVGKIIFETSVATTPTAIAGALKPYRQMLESVAQETGTKARWLHKELTKRRLPMLCLDARHTHAALAANRNKTDKNDARGIATLLCRGIFTTAHIKSDEALRIRLLLTTRRAMLRKALDLQIALRMTLKSFGGCVEKKAGKITIKRTTLPHDHLMSRLFLTTARASDALMSEAEILDKMAVRMARADPICRRLMTVPGVGPITALTFRAGVDDPKRFKSSRDVAAHFGLTPRRFQSGQADFYGHISRMGDGAVRTALYQSARVLLTNSKSGSALRLWALKLAAKKPFKVAAVACARKLAVVMHRMWVTGRDFDPKRG
jgi:transposase